ncbi:uncharacterized protein BDR25DRAFT_262698 [Lindgomyces ingoldianus]|uniref:Uncharacterized protein n=1 Tax=Lindgomyces ingoldianus TaxID=673940 RepID=A0ACB6QSS0_9PLEO|nr:uncharacterized protein BDR25DRAFT_262698 [Lindgomyces ingoldianus]KAF2470074.1 hypothetical protein BDR25DRAFT_262698 [Lindgomyces ingoldianus]
MAAAPQAAPQTGQQAGPTGEQPRPTPNVAFDNLQAMMNLVLVSSGRFIKEQQAGGGSGRMQFAMKRAVPAALERFQDSLDELENELQHAQTALRRDLALLQADRRKREQAEAAERQRLAAESSARKNVVAKQETTAETNAPASSTKLEVSTVDTQSEQPAPQPVALNREHEPPPPITTTVAPIGDLLFDGTPTTANPQDSEFDFEAMFGDSGIMDTSGDASNNQASLDIDTSAADLTFSLDESGPSLLPGLEDFAKDGDDTNAGQPSGNIDMDFTMPDLPDVNANQSSSQTDAKPAETSTADQPADGGDSANLYDTITIDYLDGLYDYDNPETTEFDNAIFGFGES